MGSISMGVIGNHKLNLGHARTVGALRELLRNPSLTDNTPLHLIGTYCQASQECELKVESVSVAAHKCPTCDVEHPATVRDVLVIDTGLSGG